MKKTLAALALGSVALAPLAAPATASAEERHPGSGTIETAFDCTYGLRQRAIVTSGFTDPADMSTWFSAWSPTLRPLTPEELDARNCPAKPQIILRAPEAIQRESDNLRGLWQAATATVNTLRAEVARQAATIEEAREEAERQTATIARRDARIVRLRERIAHLRERLAR